MIQLLSDTFTKPSKPMREAMASAVVGDDVFRQDPTINKLQEYAADLFGKEDALFCPSGTMANQIAIKVQTKPLDEVWCDELSHIYQYETAGYSFHSGVGLRMCRTTNGVISVDDLKRLEHGVEDWLPVPRMIVLENTCNKGGGNCYSLEQLKQIYTYSRELKMSLHIDGARVFNAIISKGYSSKDIGDHCDSISVCLSKGLGAPVGSLVIGTKEFVDEARRVRKVMGGGMRQAGILAAGGLFALNNHIDRLEEDHDKALRLKDFLIDCKLVKEIMPVETNIVIFELQQRLSADEFVGKAQERGLSCSAFGSHKVRFVTHLDVSKEEIEQCYPILKELLN